VVLDGPDIPFLNLANPVLGIDIKCDTSYPHVFSRLALWT
jgi:hypothetical protein